MQTAFHPLTRAWFESKFVEPTPPQTQGWPKILTGEHTLIAAPTGMGKTMTAFLCLLNKLIAMDLKGNLETACRILYISPLKALGNDIHKNLIQPLAEIRDLAPALGYPVPGIRVAVRSGDTEAKERRAMLVRPPHILITTPESFHILLCAERSREILKTVNTVIVDEIHASAGSKRGAHLSLSLERLERLVARPPQRIGLSATQKPIKRMAQVLVGNRTRPDGQPDCHIVDVGSHRKMDLSIALGDDALGPIGTHEYWAQIYEMIVKNIEDHKTTIIFTHTRRLVERISHQLSEKLGKDKVAAHHGSLSKETRLRAEQRLKSGEIPVIVSSASLELGIDVGTVDLVIHIGAPRVLASLLQRVGRAGHVTGAIPKGILYPLTLHELLQSAAAVRAVRQGELDEIIFQKHPLDVLSQVLVAESTSGEIPLEDLWNMVRLSHDYRDLPRREFDEVITMLSEGIATSRGRASAYLHVDRVNQIVSGRRNARLASLTSGGTIPEAAEYDVVQEPDELLVGKVNEDFAIESMAGDIFLLGNRSWRIRRVEKNRLRVIDAEGAPPTIPFWLGEAPSRTLEMSQAVSALRKHIADHLHQKTDLEEWLQRETGIPLTGARQLIQYIEENISVLGAVPTLDRVIAERFFDEAGGMQLILHTPFGGRINRAWGLAMRKRFCLTFDFELQCAATEDGILFSLGEQHSFPLDSVWEYLHPKTLKEDLIHAVLPHPIFLNRFRWNAGRALAILRFQGGKKVPINLQRMKSEDLLAAVFPAHVGCQDNRTGPIEPVDHPLVNETLENCLQEAMDLEGLLGIIEKIRAGTIQTVSVETTIPSPFSHEILNAAPYAFLDDAPLEERRSRAVQMRKVNPKDDLGKLDPEVVGEVIREALPEWRNANELHDFLLGVLVADPVLLTGYETFLAELQAAGRLSPCSWKGKGGGAFQGYVCAERFRHAKILFPDLRLENSLPELAPLPKEMLPADRQEVITLLFQGWMEALGPVTEENLARRLGFSPAEIASGLAALEARGLVFQGHYTEHTTDKQWCARSLLMRMHHRTLNKLRKQVEPVTPADYMRFLFRWQHVHPGSKLNGPKGLLEIISQLQGLELPLSAWEEKILGHRMLEGKPLDLDQYFFSGQLTWCRMRAKLDVDSDTSPEASRWTKNFPLAILFRKVISHHLHYRLNPEEVVNRISGLPHTIYRYLMKQGASFLEDMSRDLNQIRSSLDEALKSLAGMGLVSCDGLQGLKNLTAVDPPRSYQPGRRFTPFHPEPSGRWHLWRGAPEDISAEERLEYYTRQLLRRYGILLREVTMRENHPFPWWQILMTLRRLEARGEIRGGRFVKGISGEQFALPEALEALKPLRRGTDEDVVQLAACDPLNLVGIIVPGDRIPSNSSDTLAFKGGEFWMAGPMGEIKARLWNEKLSSEIYKTRLLDN